MVLQGAGFRGPLACRRKRILHDRSGQRSTCQAADQPPGPLPAALSLDSRWRHTGSSLRGSPLSACWLQAHLDSTCILRGLSVLQLPEVERCKTPQRGSAPSWQPCHRLPASSPVTYHPAYSLGATDGASSRLQYSVPQCLSACNGQRDLCQQSGMFLSGLTVVTALSLGQLSHFLCHSPYLPCCLLDISTASSALQNLNSTFLEPLTCPHSCACSCAFMGGGSWPGRTTSRALSSLSSPVPQHWPCRACFRRLPLSGASVPASCLRPSHTCLPAVAAVRYPWVGAHGQDGDQTGHHGH